MSFRLSQYRAPDFSLPVFAASPDVPLAPAPKDGVAPDGFHSMGIDPEYFKLNGRWVLAEHSRMDCVPVVSGDQIRVLEFRHLKKGDLVVLGRQEDGSRGIYTNARCFAPPREEAQPFAFRKGRSRETGFSQDYQEIVQLLQYEKEHGGFVTWVLGPAFSFDAEARAAFVKLIRGGFVQALLAGNALAVHDLEGAWLHTALGVDIATQKPQFNGHYNHLDLINKVRAYGSIPAFLEGEQLSDGIIAACVQEGVPYTLVGSVRDDGPIPEVFEDVYAGQDDMRRHISRSTTVIGMATMLHTIAAGNLTPTFHVLPDGQVRPVYFYAVDVSEFVVNKLADRGSLSAKGIVANAQDFVAKLTCGLGL